MLVISLLLQPYSRVSGSYFELRYHSAGSVKRNAANIASRSSRISYGILHRNNGVHPRLQVTTTDEEAYGILNARCNGIGAWTPSMSPPRQHSMRLQNPHGLYRSRLRLLSSML